MMWSQLSTRRDRPDRYSGANCIYEFTAWYNLSFALFAEML